MTIKCLDLLHTGPIPNPTKKQIEEYLKEKKPITAEEIQSRNRECDKYFKEQKLPKGYE